MFLMRRILLIVFFVMPSYAKMTQGLEDIFCERNHWKYICDFVYENRPFNADAVFPGAIVYATGHNIDRFFREVNPRIKHPYILVTMDGGVLPQYLDEPKVIAWFANESYPPAAYHPKCHLIPLGFYRHINNPAAVSNQLRQFRKNQKSRLLYLNFNMTQFGSREYIFNTFKAKDFVFVGSLCRGDRRPFMQYMEEMSHFKFAFSPRGDSFDGYRHWEAIMIGSIPIMKRASKWNCGQLFDDMPVLWVDDWDEVTEEFLNEKYKEISSKEYDISKLFLQYWANIINDLKRSKGY